MCVLFNMDRTRTSPYHPESDRMVEQINRTLQDMLAKYVSDHLGDGVERLPLEMMVYRSSVHASTQYTSFYLLFGHEVRVPFVVMFGQQSDHKPEEANYTRKLREEVHEHARGQLWVAQKR